MRPVLLVFLTVSAAEFVLERRPAFLLVALSSLAMLLYRLFMRVHFRPTMALNRAKVGVRSSKPRTR